MSLRAGQDYFDPNGGRVTVVDIYETWRSAHESVTTVALIERPTGRPLTMSLGRFNATYRDRPQPKEAN